MGKPVLARRSALQHAGVVPKIIPTYVSFPTPAEAGFSKAGTSVGYPPLSEIRRNMIPLALECLRWKPGIHPRPRPCLRAAVHFRKQMWPSLRRRIEFKTYRLL
jgi:hypothetical protein